MRWDIHEGASMRLDGEVKFFFQISKFLKSWLSSV